MTKQRLFTLVLAGLVLATFTACGGGPAVTETDTSESSTENVAASMSMPPWMMDIPSEPGKAFYGVGASTFKDMSQLNRGFRTADMNARTQIAETMRVTVQGATKEYARQVVSRGGELDEESFSQTVTRALVDFTLSGCTIVRHDFHENPRNGRITVFSLARIGFDNVAESLHQAAKEDIERVVENSRAAFDELDDMLRNEWEKEHAPAPAPDSNQGPNRGGSQ